MKFTPYGGDFLCITNSQFLVRSGYMRFTAGELWEFGINGYDWSSQTDPRATRAYYFGFGLSDVTPSKNYSDRFYGFSLRCLAS